MLKSTVRAIGLAICVSFYSIAGLANPAGVELSSVTRIATVDHLNDDPTWLHTSGHQIREQSFGRVHIARVQPEVESIPVIGGDRILRFVDGVFASMSGQDKPLSISTTFQIGANAAILHAFKAWPSDFIRDPSVERVSGLEQRVFIATDAGLVGAYQVRIPCINPIRMRDVLVRAHDGAILRISPVVKMQDAGPAVNSAGIFEYAPAPSGAGVGDLVMVELPGLPDDLQVGDHLRGDYVETFNCCKEFVCVGGGTTCEPEDRRCPTPEDTEIAESYLDFEIPTDRLDGIDLITLPNPLYAHTVFCTESPRLRAASDGFHPQPIDLPKINDPQGLSESDEFAELQAYYATAIYFEHIRDILDDETFCLVDSSMQCDDRGLPIRDEFGDPVHPFHVAVNQMFPDVITEEGTANLINEVLPTALGGEGRGDTVNTPVVVKEFARIDNAMFIPALQGSPIQVPPEFEALVQIFTRPYDSNFYFQGNRDFAYDGDIVFHEFTHALVHTFAPQLLSVTLDEQGVTAAPGAMNEGWSDYFAASFTGNPNTGAYAGSGRNESGEGAIRIIDNEKRCPEDLTAEVHDDSEPFSGALWDLRSAIIDTYGANQVNTLDRALLAAVAQSSPDESYADQAARVATEVSTAFDEAAGDLAEAAFADHGLLDCRRVFTLTEVDDQGLITLHEKELLLLPSAEEAGTAARAPGQLQFRVETPPGTEAFTLTWDQGTNSAGILSGGLFGSEPDAQIAVIAAERETPFRWNLSGTFPVPLDENDNPIPFETGNPENRSTVSADEVPIGRFSVAYQDTCKRHVYHVQMVALAEGISASNIRIAYEDAADDCDTEEKKKKPAPEDCTCVNASAESAAWGSLIPLFLFGMLSRRNRRNKSS